MPQPPVVKRTLEIVKKSLLPSANSFIEGCIEDFGKMGGKHSAQGDRYFVTIDDFDLVERHKKPMSIVFGEILPNLFSGLKKLNYEPTFIEAKRYESFEITLSPISTKRKTKQKIGYHYTSNVNNVLREGLIPHDSLNPDLMVPSVWKENVMTNGLYEEKRVYFFLERDDIAAKQTFGDSVQCVVVDLSNITLYIDETFMGDEDETPAVYSTQHISPDRIKLPTQKIVRESLRK